MKTRPSLLEGTTPGPWFSYRMDKGWAGQAAPRFKTPMAKASRPMLHTVEAGGRVIAVFDDEANAILARAAPSLAKENEELRTERDGFARSFLSLRAMLLEGALDMMSANDRDYESFQSRVAATLEASLLAKERATAILEREE